MDASEADQRIVKSRHTLATYLQMTRAGVEVAPGTRLIVDGEIAKLEEIAETHPIKAAKLERLVAEWRAFGQQIAGKLH